MKRAVRDRIIGKLPKPRFDTYLNAAGGDPDLALELYTWNIDAAAAVAGTSAIVEVALRETIDRQLRVWNLKNGGPPEWIVSPQGALAHIVRPTPPASWIPQTGIEALHRRWWERKARETMKDQFGNIKNPQPTHDDLVAALSFGAWVSLIPRPSTLKRRNNGPAITLWRDALDGKTNYVMPGQGINAASSVTYYRVTLLRYARNCASHLEPLLDTQELMGWHKNASRLLASMWPGTDVLISGPARIPRAVQAKPKK